MAVIFKFGDFTYTSGLLDSLKKSKYGTTLGPHFYPVTAPGAEPGERGDSEGPSSLPQSPPLLVGELRPLHAVVISRLL